ncbi:phage late control D family protein [Chromohalobacter nigrandesensis]|uniref:phage late control D family protein n=1 Tax=Chromohalobacter nigrandesensis TaxID=119863 RepID=UPI001FF3C508|nr:contractile injection system protein, VgrG/Pvc8 family [Chromohalobacter nigrandesensis]MCK0743553.1 hypothetical protein [Chromohalobacter nigrandesensis]
MKPTFRITANDEDITRQLRERFVSLKIRDESGADSDELTLVVSDHAPEDPLALPPTGAELEAFLGYDDDAVSMGRYVVDSLEMSWPPNQLKIVAKAAPQAKSDSGEGSTRPMLQTKKTRSWDAGTLLGDMARSIAGEHDLDPAIQDVMASIALPHVDQTDESDMNLLTRLARDYDGIAKPAGGALVIAKRAASMVANESGESLPTVPVTPDMVSSGRMKLAKRGNAGSVVARWRDTDAAATLEITEGEGEPVQRLQTIHPDEESARAAARAELRRGQRGEQTLNLTLPGDTRLMAEGRLALSDFREGADGEWLITSVTHTLNDAGYQCQVKGELPSD